MESLRRDIRNLAVQIDVYFFITFYLSHSTTVLKPLALLPE
jgi:hypothetical protein